MNQNQIIASFARGDMDAHASKSDVAPAGDCHRRLLVCGPPLMRAATVIVTGRTAARVRSTQARSAMRAHARTQVASACRACGEHVDARRTTRRFCSSPCRQRAYRAGRRPILVPVARQRRIREREAALDPRPAMSTFEGCTVEQVPFAAAKAIILRYEWLGSMPTGTRACYGLRTPSGELAGVTVFAAGPAPESGDLCGREHRDLAICLPRGACVHWAPPNAASFLISRACKLAAKQFGWRIFFAYADWRAGEYGAVYQAANWLYLGAGTGRSKGRSRWRFFSRREGRWRSERGLHKRRRQGGIAFGSIADLRAQPEWIPDLTPDKGRYVWFAGTWREKRDLRQKLKYAPQPYPKRKGGRPDALIAVGAAPGGAK